MDEELYEIAKDRIQKIFYMTISTVCEDSSPWGTPVLFAQDENLDFYTFSYRENQHSQNIRRDGKAFIVIYDSNSEPSKGRGVYMKVIAKEISNPLEIAKAIKTVYARQKKTPREIFEFLKEYPRRVYKFTPLQVWVNIYGKRNGNHVDERVEINLEKLRKLF